MSLQEEKRSVYYLEQYPNDPWNSNCSMSQGNEGTGTWVWQNDQWRWEEIVLVKRGGIMVLFMGVYAWNWLYFAQTTKERYVFGRGVD